MIDCAEQNCKFYLTAKNLKLHDYDNQRKLCERSLKRAEYVKSFK